MCSAGFDLWIAPYVNSRQNVLTSYMGLVRQLLITLYLGGVSLCAQRLSLPPLRELLFLLYLGFFGVAGKHLLRSELQSADHPLGSDAYLSRQVLLPFIVTIASLWLCIERATQFKLIGVFVSFAVFFASFFYESYFYLIGNDR